MFLQLLVNDLQLHHKLGVTYRRSGYLSPAARRLLNLLREQGRSLFVGLGIERRSRAHPALEQARHPALGAAADRHPLSKKFECGIDAEGWHMQSIGRQGLVIRLQTHPAVGSCALLDELAAD